MFEFIFEHLQDYKIDLAAFAKGYQDDHQKLLEMVMKKLMDVDK